MEQIPVVSGVVLYRGPSRLDGQPIVAIATLKSENVKTGNMVQIWILRADQAPTEALNTGADASACGSCPLRGILAEGRNKGRACYVQVRNAPLAVWNSWKAGNYPAFDARAHLELFRGRMVRLGAYGDPAALPIRAVASVLRVAKGWTGYTHQWRQRRFARWQRYVMASCESTEGAIEAQARGWRTFRVRPANAPALATEIVCPAAEEAGKRITCERCGACNGGRSEKRSVVIIGHGGKAVMPSLGRYVTA
jgi:hypothetical protein